MARKIVQIASAGAGQDGSSVFALANDGSLWQLHVPAGPGEQQAAWLPLPDLPEPQLSSDFAKDPILG